MIIYSVSEITSRIRKRLTEIGYVWVKGEVSNLKYHSSGHIYLSLKDENAVLKVVIFKNAARKLDHQIEEGRIFQIYGRVDIWDRASQYQIIGEKVLPGKLGTFYLEFQEIKNRLEGKGYFSEEHKKDLPKFPEVIGIATSGKGAAVRDILKIIKKRYPPVRIIIRDTLVQGEKAPDDIVSAINEFRKMDDMDLLILSRGGGSIEDLWAFNNEEVAKTIFDCEIPVLSAVGHERDFTISDFVADRRAATPTEAGQIAVPSKDELLELLKNSGTSLVNLISQKVLNYRAKIRTYEKSYALKKPISIYEMKLQNIDYLEEKLSKSMLEKINRSKDKLKTLVPEKPDFATMSMVLSNCEKNIKKNIRQKYRDKREKISSLERTLNAVSYTKTLERGYSIVSKNDNIIKKAENLDPGDRVKIKFYSGKSLAEIKETIEDQEKP